MAAPQAENVGIVRRVANANKVALERLGVDSLAVFGAVARGEARPDSDVDILVDFRGEATLSRFMELKSLLESSLGRRVDLVTRKALRDRLRPAIEKDAVRVA